MKDRGVHRRQPLRVFVIEGIVMEGMASIQNRYHSFRKQKSWIVALLPSLGKRSTYCKIRPITRTFNSKTTKMKLPAQMINTTNEQRLVKAHETPLKGKGDAEDVSSELDNWG
ncbi:hypothetical protein TNCV_3241391 [Trichonephila clavipes]|nr:hypothetical protein TNCV_3241391 [Trichonephila clavipes]